MNSSCSSRASHHSVHLPSREVPSPTLPLHDPFLPNCDRFDRPRFDKCVELDGMGMSILHKRWMDRNVKVLALTMMIWTWLKHAQTIIWLGRITDIKVAELTHQIIEDDTSSAPFLGKTSPRRGFELVPKCPVSIHFPQPRLPRA